VTVIVTLVTVIAVFMDQRFGAQSTPHVLSCILTRRPHYDSECTSSYRLVISFAMLGAVAFRSEKSVFLGVLAVDAFLLLSLLA
jgi:hypothetical protein